MRKIADFIMMVIRDLIGLAGFALISYGAWLTYKPAGFIVAGVLLSGIAYLIARSEQ